MREKNGKTIFCCRPINKSDIQWLSVKKKKKKEERERELAVKEGNGVSET